MIRDGIHQSRPGNDLVSVSVSVCGWQLLEARDDT